jgi:predicted DsbA family dithiol-disulfide isomerase
LSDALTVPLYYDFASSLCYVAHRALPRSEAHIAQLGIALVWTPLDLGRLVGGYRAGHELHAARRANAARVAEELGVALRVPHVWPDSRALAAAALLAEPLGRGSSWRERAFCAVFEEGRLDVDAEGAAALARELSLDLAPAAIAAALPALDALTDRARAEQVSGVPTFLLGRWPFGGIQNDDTLLRVLERFAEKARAGALS